MRATNAFLLGGILLLVFAAVGLINSIIDPDRGDSVRGILLVGTPLFPAMMGLVLIVAGYAIGLLSRTTLDSQRLV